MKKLSRLSERRCHTDAVPLQVQVAIYVIVLDRYHRSVEAFNQLAKNTIFVRADILTFLDL